MFDLLAQLVYILFGISVAISSGCIFGFFLLCHKKESKLRETMSEEELIERKEIFQRRLPWKIVASVLFFVLTTPSLSVLLFALVMEYG